MTVSDIYTIEEYHIIGHYLGLSRS